MRCAALAVLLLLAGCINPLSLLGGGGPKVSANVQAGAENAQTIGASTAQKVVRPQARSIEQSTGNTGVRTEAVQSVVVHNEAPAWVWIIAILAVGVMGAALADEIRDRLRKARPQA